ncbi:MAG: hypothetical protein CMP91_06885 [Gammaproteobacteria bacterium]|nr:hypothetical protein [Gammaproteobacteria bacterium]MAY01408.1 hypothetical protein [Gammaproteobacteria bacterium]|tara:strand:+ start:8450 stop:9070 length:621 start_codon:yes stop_codon:yes gene_type:complete
MNKFIKIKSLLIICCLLSSGLMQAQDNNQYLRFTVMAMAPDLETRMIFEDELVRVLREDDYDVVASHTLVPEISPAVSLEVRQALIEAGIQAALVLRPLATGNDASITAAQEALSQQTYTSLAAFINDYRGHNFESQAVVHVLGFLLDPQQSRLFWQGVIWLDDTVETQEQAIEKLVELVQFNLNQSRTVLRHQLGLPPLIIMQEE